MAAMVEVLAGDGEQRGLARPGGAFDHHQRGRAGQRSDRGGLAGIEASPIRSEYRCDIDVANGFSAAHRQPTDQVGLHIEHMLGSQRPHVLRRRLLPQWHARGQGAGGEVFRELGAH